MFSLTLLRMLDNLNIITEHKEQVGSVTTKHKLARGIDKNFHTNSQLFALYYYSIVLKCTSL